MWAWCVRACAGGPGAIVCFMCVCVPFLRLQGGHRPKCVVSSGAPRCRCPPQPRSDACARLADTKAGARAGRAKAFPALRRRKGPLRQCVGAQSCPEDPFQPCADAKALSGNVWAQDLHVRGVSRRSILAWEIWNGRADTATRPCPVVPRKSPRQSGNRQDLVGSVELTALGIQAKTSSPG